LIPLLTKYKYDLIVNVILKILLWKDGNLL